MPVVAEIGLKFRWFHSGSGHSVGPVETIDHHVVPGQFSVHVGLARVQATNKGPFGAVIGVMKFGAADFGTNPADWDTAQYGTVASWTIAMQVIKGEMSAWEFIQVWE